MRCSVHVQRVLLGWLHKGVWERTGKLLTACWAVLVALPHCHLGLFWEDPKDSDAFTHTCTCRHTRVLCALTVTPT